MSDDIIKPLGPTKASKPDAGGGNTRNVPVLGIVKNNVDPIRAGRLQVYISDFGSNDPDDSNAWITVSYMSPFFGSVEPKAGDTGYGSYTANPSSYGFWNSPPDIGSTVICIFINGDTNYGFYIGCVPNAEALQMVPAIGSTTNIITNNQGEAEGYGGSLRLPVTNINTNNAAIADSSGFLDAPKPIHSYVAAILNQQGLIRDPIRGTISSSAQRESPSRVGWGVSTPGRPIYEGGYTDENIANRAVDNTQPAALRVIARRGGHSIVMDDGNIVGQDQLIRIRSAAGHQILMSDDGQTLFIIHSNGQSYIELGKEGTIDMYSTNSVNIRTQGDLNLHADNDVNIHAAKKFNLRAEEINIQSEKNTNLKVGENHSIDTGAKFTHKVAGPMSMSSAGDASYASSATTYINGSRINLNTGSSSTVPQAVQPITLTAHTDTLFDKTKGYAAAPGKLLSVTSRAPAHAPWANAGKGVDVKTTTNASASLPTSPSSAVAATNAAASTAPIQKPVNNALISTVPSTKNASAAIDKTTTNALVSTAAQNATINVPAAILNRGYGTINTSSGPVAVIGKLGQTVEQLERAGVLKPGSARLVNSLIRAGMAIQKAIPNSMFTGKYGVTGLTDYINNPTAQVNSQVQNFQRTQTGLTSAGLITGRESSIELAGLVVAGTTAGMFKTVEAVKNIASLKLPGTGTTGVVGEVTNLINAGRYAANLAQGLSGLSSIASALSSKKGGSSNLKGSVASAYSTILNSFRPLQVGVPQNLREIAVANAEQRAMQSNLSQLRNAGISDIPQIPTSGKIKSITSNVFGAIEAAKSLSKSKSTTQTISAGLKLANSISTIVKSIGGSTYASGIDNLPGGQNTAMSIVNTASGRMSLPGTSLISAFTNNYSTAITNNISLPQSISGSLGAANGLLSTISSNLSFDATSLANKLRNGSSSLTSLFNESQLPSDALSSVNSAIGSLSSNSSNPIKVPSVGINTNDRSEITAQLDSVLGDPRIPRPNFTGETRGSTDIIDSTLEVRKQLQKEYDQLVDKKELARQKWVQLRDSLPKGDPSIEQARLEFESYAEEVRRKSFEIINK